MSRVFPNGIDEAQREQDLTRGAFGEDADKMAHSRTPHAHPRQPVQPVQQHQRSVTVNGGNERNEQTAATTISDSQSPAAALDKQDIDDKMESLMPSPGHVSDDELSDPDSMPEAEQEQEPESESRQENQESRQDEQQQEKDASKAAPAETTSRETADRTTPGSAA
jgi:hypothetical protein